MIIERENDNKEDYANNKREMFTKEIDRNQINRKDEKRKDFIKTFDWKNRWLKGEEYYYILTHADLYSSLFSFSIYPPKTHPQSTYLNPQSKNKRQFIFVL